MKLTSKEKSKLQALGFVIRTHGNGYNVYKVKSLPHGNRRKLRKVTEGRARNILSDRAEGFVVVAYYGIERVLWESTGQVGPTGKRVMSLNRVDVLDPGPFRKLVDSKPDNIDQAVQELVTETLNKSPKDGYMYRPTSLREREGEVLVMNKRQLRELRLRADAPVIQMFGDNQWNSVMGQCAVDYLSCVTSWTKDKLRQWFMDRDPACLKEGVRVKDLEAYCIENNHSFYLVFADWRLKVKTVADRSKNHKESVMIFVNNCHVYPILNETFRNRISGLVVGDCVLHGRAQFDSDLPLVVYKGQKIDYEKEQNVIVVGENVNQLVMGSKGEMPNYCKVGKNGNVCHFMLNKTLVWSNPDFVEINEALCGMRKYWSSVEKPEMVKQYEYRGQNLIGLSFQILNDLSNVSFTSNKSNYCAETRDIIHGDENVRPRYEMCHSTPSSVEEHDMRGCHRFIMRTCTVDIPIYRVCDQVSTFDCPKGYNPETHPLPVGRYYVDATVEWFNGQPLRFVTKPCWFDSSVVDYLVMEKLITIKDVRLQLLPSYQMSSDPLKDVDDIVSGIDCGKQFKKNFFNHLCGYFGKVRSHSYNGFVSAHLFDLVINLL